MWCCHYFSNFKGLCTCTPKPRCCTAETNVCRKRNIILNVITKFTEITRKWFLHYFRDFKRLCTCTPEPRCCSAEPNFREKGKIIWNFLSKLTKIIWKCDSAIIIAISSGFGLVPPYRDVVQPNQIFVKKEKLYKMFFLN